MDRPRGAAPEAGPSTTAPADASQNAIKGDDTAAPRRRRRPPPSPPPDPAAAPLSTSNAPPPLPSPTSASSANNWRTRPFTGEFRDPRVERAFWTHLRDSGRLSQLDALASSILCFCMLTAVAVFCRQGMPAWPSAVAGSAMLLLTAASRGRWRVYERHRTLVVALARVLGLFATCSNAFLNSPLFEQAWGAAFLQSGGSRSSGAAHAAAVALASSGRAQGDAGGFGGGGGSGGGSSPSAAALASNFYSHFGAGVPGHWVTVAANSTPWGRHWSAFFTRTPRVHALLLPSLFVMPPRAHGAVSLLCASASLAVLGSTVAGREAVFGREKHVEVARFLSSLTRWLVRLPSSNAAAAVMRGGGSGDTGGNRPPPPRLLLQREIAEDRATAAVMIVMQVFLGLLLPTHVMFAWQAKARRAFRYVFLLLFLFFPFGKIFYLDLEKNSLFFLFLFPSKPSLQGLGAGQEEEGEGGRGRRRSPQPFSSAPLVEFLCRRCLGPSHAQRQGRLRAARSGLTGLSCRLLLVRARGARRARRRAQALVFASLNEEKRKKRKKETKSEEGDEGKSKRVREACVRTSSFLEPSPPRPPLCTFIWQLSLLLRRNSRNLWIFFPLFLRKIFAQKHRP